jgi:carbamoyl-phosphate synthase small subunit
MTLNLIKAKTAYLILADGTIFKGKSFGSEGKAIGEVVFSTSMVGYQEAITDPSYCGQLMVQTFPLIGNYGVNSEDYSSEKISINGYIVREYCEAPSNFRSEGDIDSFLKKHGIIGLFDIDTRRLTRILREKGVMNGMITTEEPTEALLAEIKEYKTENAVAKVSGEKKEFKAENGKYKVALIDYGFTMNIVNSLIKRGCNVTTFPYNVTAAEIKEFSPDGIVLSNGPADPKECEVAVSTLKELNGENIPTFGIGLGHQLLALANGFDTEKLKYGHRGASQPVTDMSFGTTYVTSQNHGYAVVNDSIDTAKAEISHMNANDKTCEGISYKNAPAFSVQFRPETGEQKSTTSYLYDKFIGLMEGNK